MRLLEDGRWPPIADGDELRAAVSSILGSASFDKTFYQQDVSRGGIACQGDVFQLTCSVPFLDSAGNAVVDEAAYDHWMILGNTCDIEREEVLLTIIAPLVPLRTALSAEENRALRRYEYAKRFFVPAWPGDPASVDSVVDFMQIASLEKTAFTSNARVVARLQFPAWALLHACLVRFLARGDGRFDEP